MARRPREDSPGSWHHVVNRAIAKRPYYESRDDQRYFLARLAAEVRAGRIEVHAYCLMTTHFHLFVRSPVAELSDAMRRVQFRYSRHFNRRRQRDGPLIRGRFFSRRADSEHYRRTIVRYIDANPVRAGLVASSAEYEFGSARAYASGRAPRWLSTEWVKEHARSLSGDRRFSPRSYRRVFGPRDVEDVESLASFIDLRMSSARDRDPLEDLVGSTPSEVQRWMRAKAMLADGHEPGLPVCGVPGLLRAIEADLAEEGEWLVDSGGRTWRGSELARVGLLRDLCSVAWSQLADMTGWSVDLGRRRDREHRAGMRRDPDHAARVERIALAALAHTLVVAGK